MQCSALCLFALQDNITLSRCSDSVHVWVEAAFSNCVKSGSFLFDVHSPATPLGTSVHLYISCSYPCYVAVGQPIESRRCISRTAVHVPIKHQNEILVTVDWLLVPHWLV